MPNESTRKAADLRKVAEALRAWGKFQGANSPEALEATRTALDLATRHFDIITESNNRWGHFGGATCALEKLSEITAERGRVDFGKYSGWWSHFTTPYGRLDGGLPDALERWAEELDKAGAVAGALAGPEAPAPVTADANPATTKPSGFLGAMDLAKKFNVPPEKMLLLHKRLERFRRKHQGDSRYVVAVESPRPREPRYLHAVEHALPVIEDLVGPSVMSGQRQSTKK
jgi:hypothetical protein